MQADPGAPGGRTGLPGGEIPNAEYACAPPQSVRHLSSAKPRFSRKLAHVAASFNSLLYWLNGQPRVTRVQSGRTTGVLPQRRKADVVNPAHLAAPMSGVIASVSAAAGQQVAPGDLFMTVEAIKMETALSADREATVREVHVQAGQQVDAKDLLLEFDPA